MPSNSLKRAGLLVVTFCCLMSGGCSQLIADKFLIPPRSEKRESILAQRRTDHQKRLGDRMNAIECRSFDGTRLAALTIAPKPADPKADKSEKSEDSAQSSKSAQPAGIVFVLHGLTDRKESMLDIAESLSNAGYFAVLPDLRAHGESGGRYTTLGFWERKDLTAFANHLARQGHDVSRVGAIGGSLGAAVAIQWAAVDSRIKAVVAVAPFAELRSELNHLYSKFDIAGFKQRILESAAQDAGRFRIPDVSPLKSIAQIQTPIYIAHGWKDDIIPASESRRLFHAAGGPVVLETVESNHIKIREVLGNKFMKRAVQWMDVYLAARSDDTPKWVARYANRNFQPDAPVAVKQDAAALVPTPAVNP